MKFTYIYKTSDGIRHVAEMSAESREEVFIALRQQKIKPIKVVAADGSKANGEVRAGSLRWTAIVVLSLLLLGAIIYIAELMYGDRTLRLPGTNIGDLVRSGSAGTPSDINIARPRVRKQLSLDDKGSVNCLKQIFNHPSEVFLVRFAEPGKPMMLPDVIDSEITDDFFDALQDEIVIKDEDDNAIVELKQVVAGLKEEAKMMVASGRNFNEIIQYFAMQQEMESKYRETIICGEGTKDEKNKLLSALGLQVIE